MERKPKRCPELVELAEQYVEAHKETGLSSKSQLEKRTRLSDETGKDNTSVKEPRPTACYTCGKRGHRSKGCWEKEAPRNPTHRC